MVTSRERDYMYKMYASDARARLNLGIRRRLAPLMENDIERDRNFSSGLIWSPVVDRHRQDLLRIQMFVLATLTASPGN